MSSLHPIGLRSTSITVLASSISTLAFSIGLNALLRPRSGLSLFGLPRPASASDETLVDGLVRLYGIRNMSMGFTTALLTYFGHAQALGWLCIGSSAVAGVDGVVTKMVTGGGEWSHWGFVPLSVGFGIVLLEII